MRRVAVLLALTLGCAAPRPAPAAAVPETETARLSRQADALVAQIETPWVRRFLAAAKQLPDVAPRTLYHDAQKTRFLSALEYAILPEADRGAWTPQSYDAEYFYGETRWGSPLAYARALELAEPGAFDPRGARVFDFGFGGIGQLKMLAGLGADVHGVDVDPVFRALYTAPGDQGPQPGEGRVTLLFGHFPAEPALVTAAGDGYRLVMSKNVLKRGYIHPEQSVDPKKTVQLGVDDATFVRTVHGMLAPGGRFLIYNICPGPNRPDQPYLPWADGRSPFTREQFEAAGFKVLAFDQDDLPAVQRMAHSLGWDRDDPPMDLQRDLQAEYTLVEKG